MFDTMTMTKVIGAPTGSKVESTHTAATKTQATITGEAPLTPLVVVGHATSGSYAIKNVVVDAEDSLKNKILLTYLLVNTGWNISIPRGEGSNGPSPKRQGPWRARVEHEKP